MVSHIKSKIGSVAGSVGEGAGELPPLEAPIWSVVPDGSAQQGTLYEIDMNVWVEGRALTGWLLTGNPAGVTISNQGLVTILDTVAAQVLSMTCYVENPAGNDTSNLFEWELETVHVPEPPVWIIVDPQSTDFNDLPAQLDMNDFVTSFLPITDWTTTEGSITGGGILVIPAGTLVQTLSIIVTAENDDGVSPSTPFDWDITQDAPVWDTVPDLDAQEGEEYQVDMNTWIISGDDLENWSLSGNPTGVTIDQTGEITILASVGETILVMDCTVENQGGQETSNTFTWELTATPLQPPIWLNQPEDQTTSDNDLPGTYDVSDLVFSLTPITWSVDAPATINTEGVISIDAVAAVYPLVVNALNEDGDVDSDPFNWEITEVDDPPIWDEVPEGYENINNLPSDVDMNDFILSGDNLTGWALSGNPAGVTISGAGIVTVADTVPASRFDMTCYVENPGGDDTSNAFTWLVADTVTITQQPVTLEVDQPNGGQFEVLYTHSDPEAAVFFQWQCTGRTVPGSWYSFTNTDQGLSDVSTGGTNPVIINSTDETDNNRGIRCRIRVYLASSDEFEIFTDEVAELLITSIPPSIDTQPEDFTFTPPNPASFTVVASHPTDADLYYLWQALDPNDEIAGWQDPVAVFSNADPASVTTNTLLLPTTSTDDGGTPEPGPPEELYVVDFTQPDVAGNFSTYGLDFRRNSPSVAVNFESRTVGLEYDVPAFFGGDLTRNEGFDDWQWKAVIPGLGITVHQQDDELEVDDGVTLAATELMKDSLNELDDRFDVGGYLNDMCGHVSLEFLEAYVNADHAFSEFFRLEGASTVLTIRLDGQPNRFQFQTDTTASQESTLNVIDPIVPGSIVDIRWRKSSTEGKTAWINGVRTDINDAVALADFSSPTTGPVRVGNGSNPNRTFPARIHLVKIIPEALSDAEILAWDNWEIDQGVPIVSPIPSTSTPENKLPENYDVSNWVISNPPATDYTSTGAGEFLDPSQPILTLPDGLPQADYGCSFDVTNLEGISSSLPFTWSVTEQEIYDYGELPDLYAVWDFDSDADATWDYTTKILTTLESNEGSEGGALLTATGFTYSPQYDQLSCRVQHHWAIRGTDTEGTAGVLRHTLSSATSDLSVFVAELRDWDEYEGTSISLLDTSGDVVCKINRHPSGTYGLVNNLGEQSDTGLVIDISSYPVIGIHYSQNNEVFISVGEETSTPIQIASTTPITELCFMNDGDTLNDELLGTQAIALMYERVLSTEEIRLVSVLTEYKLYFGMDWNDESEIGPQPRP